MILLISLVNSLSRGKKISIRCARWPKVSETLRLVAFCHLVLTTGDPI